MDITILCFFHLIFINSLFILVDYLILKRMAKPAVPFLWVAIAGLTSLFLGISLTNIIINYYFNEQWFGFENGIVKRNLFITGAVIFILWSIFIEFIFYIIATKKITVSLKSSFVANLATNVPVGSIYLLGEMYYSHND